MTRRRRFALALCAALCGLAAGPALGEDGRLAEIEARHGGGTSFAVALEALQYSVAIGDGASVAALARYPFVIDSPSRSREIRGEAEFAALYPEIVTPEIAEAIARHDVEAMRVTETGVASADGTLEWVRRCTDRSCSVVYWLIGRLAPPAF